MVLAAPTRSCFFLLALVALSASSAAIAQDPPRLRGFYPNVLIATHDNLSLEFLNEAVASMDDCKAAAAMIASTVQASCTKCTVVKLQCVTKLDPRQQRLLSEEPVE